MYQIGDYVRLATDGQVYVIVAVHSLPPEPRYDLILATDPNGRRPEVPAAAFTRTAPPDFPPLHPAAHRRAWPHDALGGQ
jgi:hypothetical protein